MTAPLAGVTVVVTRPARQAGRFVGMLRQAGASTVLMPTLEIDPVELGAGARDTLAPDRFDWVIYTSSNAVESALRQLPRPTRARVAAIGRATARTLHEHGVSVDAMPQGAAESEGLLALPTFADPAGTRILIMKGLGGRTLLQDELARRGADVVLGEVYHRRPVGADPTALDALGRATDSGNPVVAVTSREILGALLDAAPDDRVPRLRDATLLVPAERVASAASGCGWRGAIIVAHGAEDGEMLAALVRHQGRGGRPDEA